MTKSLLGVFISIAIMAGCERSSCPMITNSVTLPMLSKLASKKIIFGHQSVGNDIIEGITLISNPLSKNIMLVEAGLDSVVSEKPALTHFLVGTNGNAESKILDFKKVMQSGAGEHVDIAFFKFCFVDIDSNTDPNSIFEKYVSVIDDLSRQYPRVMFLHCTVPLTTVRLGIKSRIQKLLGIKLLFEQDNLQREAFNSLLRNHYGNRVFDLAFFESSTLDNARISGEMNGKLYYSLNPAYTYDGGHLNDVGKQIIAEKLLRYLYEQCSEV